MNNQQLEKYSSAITLSDMEIFVFPELMYALVLANIISPVIWQWRQADCFKRLHGKPAYKKLMRLKQFIMDEYEFNLDLNTWGLTSKKNELKRFESFISPEAVAQSNALFGYQGDKYYFDVDIRKHFGLDQYDGDIIPYWKTETIEAMNAFHLKPGYETGAGECVSLSALYAAAAFVVCGIPLEDIFMILTPLHSQNFINVNGGVLTNNRRIITKSMWFNGTTITTKAQRAIRNEQATIVAHSSGYLHCVYNDATIDKLEYERFLKQLDSYLSTDLTPLIFANFLRCYNQYQRHFQFCRDCRGQAKFIKAESLFQYEHGSNFRIADSTHEKLLDEVSDEDYLNYQLWERIRCDEFEQFLNENKVDLKTEPGQKTLKDFVTPLISNADQFVNDVADFIHVEAKLPPETKNFTNTSAIQLSVDQTREQIIEYLQSIRTQNSTADLTFYAYRDMETCDWQPFITAAIRRNPVSIQMTADKSIEQVYNWLKEIRNSSIYSENRLAQPDEVANYLTGDGIEKAFFMANVIKNKTHDQNIEIIINNNNVLVKSDREYYFTSNKKLNQTVNITPDSMIRTDSGKVRT